MRIGFLVSPPVVGLIADATSLRAGLLVVPLCGVVVLALAGVLPRRPRQPLTGPRTGSGALAARRLAARAPTGRHHTRGAVGAEAAGLARAARSRAMARAVRRERRCGPGPITAVAGSTGDMAR